MLMLILSLTSTVLQVVRYILAQPTNSWQHRALSALEVNHRSNERPRKARLLTSSALLVAELLGPACAAAAPRRVRASQGDFPRRRPVWSAATTARLAPPSGSPYAPAANAIFAFVSKTQNAAMIWLSLKAAQVADVTPGQWHHADT